MIKNNLLELRLLDQKLQKKSEKLEGELRNEGKKHAERIQDLQRSQQAAFQSFQDLEERISAVAARVVHLGEQLEGVNTPRNQFDFIYHKNIHKRATIRSFNGCLYNIFIKLDFWS